MDWANERFVRLYTRDTMDWILLSWDARCVWMAMLRKFDRAGVIDIGKHGLRGLAVMLGAPPEVVERAIPELLADGCLVADGEAQFCAPNYIEANETPMSDAQRQRDARAKRRERAIKSVTKPVDGVTKPFTTVTGSHAASRAVTRRHSDPVRTDPVRTDPKYPPSPHDPVTIRDSSSQLTLAGGPDAPHPKGRLNGKRHGAATPEERAICERVIERLNKRAERGYDPDSDDTRAKLVALLRAGRTENDLRLVVWHKANEWAKDKTMDKYLKPRTLFGPENFGDYLVEAKEAWSRRHPAKTGGE